MSELVEQLKEIFPTEPLPPKPIAPHLCDQCAAVRKDFARLRWDQVPKKLIDKHLDGLLMFSDAAFRYYIPAYVVRAVETMYTALWGGEVAEHMLYALAPEDLPKSVIKKRFAFTKTQKQALSEWVGAYLTLPDPLAIMEGRNALELLK